MEIELYDLFKQSPALVIFVAIGLGYLIGKVNIRGFELGPTGGVLLVGLLFGHFGFDEHPFLGTIGFILFIYSVGFQAGPRFFNVLLEDGPRYIALSVVVALTGFVVAKLLALTFDLDSGFTAGILAGAMTSTPTLVGAQNALDAGIAVLGPGLTAEDIRQHLSVGYAITYVFGTIGLILIVKFLPGVLRIDLVGASRQYAQDKGYSETEDTLITGLPVVRGYQIMDGEMVGKTRREVEATRDLEFGLVRLVRDGEVIEFGLDDEIKAGDKAAILARPERHAELRDMPDVKPGILDRELLDSFITSQDIVVSHESAVSRPLRELRITEDFGCFVTKIRRAQIDLPVDRDTTLMKADILTVAGDAQAIERLAGRIGSIEKDIKETDLVTFAFGIVIGLLIGMISLKIGNINVGIGSAGGLLLSGIIFGYLRASYPTFGRVPPAARYIIMELGLMFFMVNVGITAGGGVVEALISVGPVLILCGILVLILPVVVGYLFGTFFLKLNPALLLGSLTGAMTSTPALSALQDAAKSSMPALGYAGTYAFANVLLTLAGTLIMLL
ncbi:MAG: transporter [Proteobacteria bacterium]|nr:transporter [Pseudomonadota bacterium]